jgi:hypothetical protein
LTFKDDIYRIEYRFELILFCFERPRPAAAIESFKSADGPKACDERGKWRGAFWAIAAQDYALSQESNQVAL